MATQLALSQPPYQSPMTDKNGMVTDAWNKWFQQLYLRIGGAATAPIQNFNALTLTNIIAATAPLNISSLYTSPIGQKTVINSFKVTNLDSVARTISVWLVPQGSLYAASNIAINAVSIAAGATVSFPTLNLQVINGGGSIQAQGSAAGVLNVISDGRLTS